MARITGYAQADVAPEWLFERRSTASGLIEWSEAARRFDLIEINEAFAAEVLADRTSSVSTGTGQRQRRRDRARPPDRRIGRPGADHAPLRASAARRTEGPRDALPGRRGSRGHGGGNHLRRRVSGDVVAPPLMDRLHGRQRCRRRRRSLPRGPGVARTAARRRHSQLKDARLSIPAASTRLVLPSTWCSMHGSSRRCRGSRRRCPAARLSTGPSKTISRRFLPDVRPGTRWPRRRAGSRPWPVPSRCDSPGRRSDRRPEPLKKKEL